MLTILDVIRRTTDYFRQSGVPNPRLDAELLLGHALGLRREQLYLDFERPLAEGDLAALRALVRRRAKREPLQYIIGEVEFFGLRLKVDRRALIPRPETEELVDILAKRINPKRILDLGSGAGAIGLALLHEFPDAEAILVDRAEEALELGRENAERTGLAGRATIAQADWFGGIPGGARFDLIVSNPPYLNEEEWKTAEPEVREYEPKGALVACNKGRAALEILVSQAGPFLSAEGLLALETGIEQHSFLEEAAKASGFPSVENLKDLSGRERFFLAWKKNR